MEDKNRLSLKVLFKTLFEYKKFITIFTVGFTILITIYFYFKPNIYQIDSLVEIGYYRDNNNKINYIEDPKNLVNKLKIIYDVDGKEEVYKFPFVKNVSMNNDTTNLIIISILGLTKEETKNFTQIVNQKIIDKHSKIIELYKKNILSNIKIYKKKLEKVNENLNLKEKKLDLNNKQVNIKTKSDIGNNAIYLLEVLKEEQNIERLQNQQFKLIDLINQEKTRLLVTNLKATKVVKLVKYKKPVKPKRKLIIFVSFILLFILAIFLVFFIEFIKSIKEEK